MRALGWACVAYDAGAGSASEKRRVLQQEAAETCTGSLPLREPNGLPCSPMRAPRLKLRPTRRSSRTRRWQDGVEAHREPATSNRPRHPVHRMWWPLRGERFTQLPLADLPSAVGVGNSQPDPNVPPHSVRDSPAPPFLAAGLNGVRALAYVVHIAAALTDGADAKQRARLPIRVVAARARLVKSSAPGGAKPHAGERSANARQPDPVPLDNRPGAVHPARRRCPGARSRTNQPRLRAVLEGD